jgi:hypothetical protein
MKYKMVSPLANIICQSGLTINSSTGIEPMIPRPRAYWTHQYSLRLRYYTVNRSSTHSLSALRFIVSTPSHVRTFMTVIYPKINTTAKYESFARYLSSVHKVTHLMANEGVMFAVLAFLQLA